MMLNVKSCINKIFLLNKYSIEIQFLSFVQIHSAPLISSILGEGQVRIACQIQPFLQQKLAESRDVVLPAPIHFQLEQRNSNWSGTIFEQSKYIYLLHSIERSRLTEIFNLTHTWLIVVRNYVWVPKQYCMEFCLKRVSFKDKAWLWRV